MRTTIRQIDDREVELHYDDSDGERRVRHFWIPSVASGWAYVRERARSGRGDDPQVCRGLSATGPTLRASPETLLSTVRRHWRIYRSSLGEGGAG